MGGDRTASETFQKGKAIRRGAKDALEGDHRFVLNGGKERHARIHVVMVLMEGAGGLIAQGLDGDEVRQAILDMGGRTTDGVATEGQDPIRHLCGTLARGVEDSKEMLSRFVENDKRYKRALRAEETESILRTHIRLKAILGLLSQKMYHQPLSDLTPDQFEHVLRMQQTNVARTLAEQLKITEADIRILAQQSLLHDLCLQDLEVRYRTLHARGTEILPMDLYTWTEKSLRSVGKDIASFASQLWRVGESGEVATDNALVLAAGGGTYYYLEDVRELIPEIKPCERPELANAAGYANFAYSALLEEMGIVV
jgi:Response regulator containing a CheY-like receiver domain and an HD-GYP domain